MTQMIWNGLKNGLGSIKNTNQPSITARRGSLGSALGQAESFSTTGTMLIKTKKQKKEIERQRVKAQEAKTTNRTNLRLREKPDPILGYSTQMPKAYLSWENCELAQLIVKKEDVWAGKINPVPVLLNQDQKKPSKKTPSSTTTTNNTPTQDNNQSLVLNFGLDENEHQKAILFDGLPKIKELLKIKNKPIFDPSDFSTPSSLDPEEATSKMGSEEDEEDLKKLRLMRILDLRNSNSKGIDKFIKLRVLKAFSPKDPINPEKLDPGCSEVQAAMLTYRIHTVLDHAWQNRRDKDSKRHLSDLVMKRMKILKYLKRVNPSSYFELLPRIGLQPKYLKDELIVRAKLPLRPGESLD
ncbi:hypothetical protein MJO29_005720 [Puccinia striiformis f. sp. tritici]|uniref:Ribosomal protein S15 n=1 Tax=Puccinia striiformis TaxID=27350 RepID=A0A2S4UF79_9BASI|nr:hypothetical protein Pst134EA_009808 [Puccinia striiformis f. sp. tritici]KAH9469287.1 hypothetical protein Pst134EA_009808 [Puccinia striiformis f. sp. tritici]KAI7960652.1 hypothetical protein MJO29_005720 [Puccinia striiformis f. sp. tritici]KAI9620699.1 hypothetical protein KEM48_008048 [Puccinia striiformis f. sp. tritici PST-130]POV95836.1 hypothetical protein PSTT_15989 [Puccinia striiformis]